MHIFHFAPLVEAPVTSESSNVGAVSAHIRHWCLASTRGSSSRATAADAPVGGCGSGCVCSEAPSAHAHGGATRGKKSDPVIDISHNYGELSVLHRRWRVLMPVHLFRSTRQADPYTSNGQGRVSSDSRPVGHLPGPNLPLQTPPAQLLPSLVSSRGAIGRPRPISAWGTIRRNEAVLLPS